MLGSRWREAQPSNESDSHLTPYKQNKDSRKFFIRRQSASRDWTKPPNWILHGFELLYQMPVMTILDNLEDGNFFVSKSDSINESDQLRMKVIELELIRNELIKSISLIKESETYQTIAEIKDWDIYFKETREKLEIELKNLENSD